MLYTTSSRNLIGVPSLFLDCLRIIASFVVFWGHAYDQWHTKIGYDYNRIDWGHSAVIVFFVLSGYVIAHTTTRNNRGPKQYAQARLSKLYSVVLPALIITALVECTVRMLDPSLAQHYIRNASWLRYVLTSFFLNEVWFFSAAPPINGPLWSLSFEFWYYVVFGLFLYCKSKRLWLFPLLACLIAGPKILLMMPIWLMGNMAYRLENPLKHKNSSWILVSAALCLAVILVPVLPSYPARLGAAPLFFAGQFITDYAIGLFIALALWLLPETKEATEGNDSKAAKRFRQFADLTFPLYVLHEPFLVLFRAIWPARLADEAQMWMAIVLVFMACMSIGHIMELNRYKWISLFKRLLARF